MKNKIVQLHSAKDFGEDVTKKEVRFLQLVDAQLSAPEKLVTLPQALTDRVSRLREKAKQVLDAEVREM